MSDEELKVQDALVNSLISHYEVVINRYKTEIEQLKSMPPVNPQEKTGHWIEISRGFECDQCHGIDTDGLEPPYCKWCGTQMKGAIRNDRY